ncbi:amidohydrolase [Mesorhizobium sp. L-8-10]|uniref:M20 aminoacylase family protein n=1 Tax=Mesorhizobium sp. L-8-10 TaxID=2744523 RepID=UPI001928829A|nr:M20 aminoacylase family protein [Mesorhizobium sp. L-8-10]BCH35470.1 amidohydrolase [Mesorhizobium sp. L-8-10]
MRKSDTAEWEMLTALRRDLHAHPELGFEETRTSAIVEKVLAEAGLAVHSGLGKTGIVATLRFGEDGRRIALRADMDALAMPETAEARPYKSTIPGKMHACGHDGHTAMLIGAARRLAGRRDLSGTVHFIFQPAEEGRGGARAMIDDGFFKLFPVDAVYGLHNMPGLEPDEMAVVAGPQLASSDRWSVTFEGVGTHGAKPHFGRDAVTAAGQFLTALHTIVARRIDPLQPAVVSACAIEGGSFEALNVIPDEVRIGGTARAFTPAVRDQIEEEIGHLAQTTAALYGIRHSYAYRRQMPPVINDANAAARALAAARSALGADKVRTAFEPSTAGDDFAMFSTEVPGAYVWLGNGPAEDGALHHNSRYDFNDAAIPSGVKFWTTLVEQELAR